MDSMGIIACLLFACLSGGVLLVRFWHAQREKSLVRSRLSEILDEKRLETPVSPEQEEPEWVTDAAERFALLAHISMQLQLAGVGMTLTGLLSLSIALFLAPIAAAVVFGAPVIVFVVVGALLAVTPYLVVSALAENRRNKFVEQLPDAIDLMISVLRSGLSIPQSVKAVSDEMPAPCGSEFGEVLHRMNLGQSLPDALSYTVEEYKIFELDLIRRATSIQMEIGGSLADLLEKTNNTLRQRIKLKRTVRVLTSQSRLAGKIICAMPFIIAVVFQMINPGYLRPLYETTIGKVFVALAVLFQAAGIFAIRKICTFKV